MQDWMRKAKTLQQDPKEGFDPASVTVSDLIEIAAPARIVWSILTDMPRYGEWNPFCVRAASTLAMGAPVEMTLVNYLVPGTLMPNVEYVCAFEPERLLSWELKYNPAFPYPARRDQMIEPTGPNSCTYLTTDAFLGEHGVHVFMFAGPWVKRAFNDTARALKARAEAMFQAEHKA